MIDQNGDDVGLEVLPAPLPPRQANDVADL